MTYFKHILFRAVLVLVPLLITALAAELYLRSAAAHERKKNEDALAEMYADRPPMQEAVTTRVNFTKPAQPKGAEVAGPPTSFRLLKKRTSPQRRSPSRAHRSRAGRRE